MMRKVCASHRNELKINFDFVLRKDSGCRAAFAYIKHMLRHACDAILLRVQSFAELPPGAINFYS